VTYPEATLIRPLFAPEGLRIYEGTVVLKAVAPAGTLAGGKAVAGSVRAQACDDESCLPPASLPVTLQVRR